MELSIFENSLDNTRTKKKKKGQLAKQTMPQTQPCLSCCAASVICSNNSWNTLLIFKSTNAIISMLENYVTANA